MIEPDFSVVYPGPKAEWASITGSPLWAWPIQQTIDAWVTRGWRHVWGDRVETPYGLGPEVHAFETTSGRTILWIPSYGDVLGKEPVAHETVERVYWVLWQAGVKAMLVGGNHGVCDFRGRDGVQPGDVVLPWSFQTHRHHRGMRGTDFANPWPQANLFLDEPFCPRLAEAFVPLLQEWQQQKVIGQIHTPQEVRAALVQVETITFETEFDILRHLTANEAASKLQPDRPPVVTLHGDAINPILARFLGIHVLYYSLVCNYAAGLDSDQGIHETMTELYVHRYPEMVIDLEGQVLESFNVPATESCRCARSLMANPDAFAQAMTGWR